MPPTNITQSIDAAQGNAFAARYVFLKPSDADALEPLLKATGAYEAEEGLQTAVNEAKEILDKVGGEGQPTFEKIVDVAADDVAATATQLANYVYEREEAAEAGKTEETEENMEGVEEAIKDEPAEVKEEDKDVVPETTNGETSEEVKPAEEDASMADAGDEAAENGKASKE